jgi:hypothetical protein
MNAHKKLLDMGFKKCEPHIKHHERYYEPYKMVPDVYSNETKTVNGKRTVVKVKKVHPKWRIFYKMVFTDTINIWVDTDKGQIKTIWLEGNIAKDGVEEIYEHYKKGQIILNSKKDIIRLFPKSIQRDFIINDIFK